jgi:phospholipid transport system substrate-binding protein
MRTQTSSQSDTIGSHKARLGALTAIAFAAGVLFSSPHARAASPAESFVAASIEKADAILKDPTLAADQRESRLHEFVLSVTDTRRIAVFTLGPYARGASELEMAGFVGAFTDFATAVYQRGFDGYKGQTMRVTSSIARAEDDTIVNGEVVQPSGQAKTVKIAFRVRRDESGKPILTDLQVEGVWLALNQRSDFTSYLQNHHGDIAQLSRELEMKAKQIQSHRPAIGPQS